MDELKLMTITGGSDLFIAGTYKTSDGTLPHPVKAITGITNSVVTSMRHRLHGSVNKVSTITLSGTSGSANISLGALVLPISFLTDLTVTATGFRMTNQEALLAMGIVLTSGTGTLVFSSTRVLFPTPTITNVSGALGGTIVTTGADGLVAASQAFLGTTLVDGVDFFMEYPVEEIVIGTGPVILHFIK